MLLHPFTNAFGIDISDLTIKIVQLKNTSQWHRVPTYKISDIRSMHIPPGLIVDGEIQKPEELRQYVLRLLGREKKGAKRYTRLKGDWVVASIPEAQSFIKLIPYQQEETETLTDKTVYEIAKRHIPFGDDPYYLDWQYIISGPDEEPETFLLLSATPKRIADNYTYLLESLGLGVIALEAEPIAITRAIAKQIPDKNNMAHAILDIGATTSSLIVYDRDSIQFSTALPFSGELVTTAIEQKLKISHEEAEKRKRKHGASFKKGHVWPIVAKQVDALVGDVKKTLRFYQSHFPDARDITTITLSGGASSLDSLDTILQEKLKLPVEQVDPWNHVVVHEKHIPKNSAGFTTAIGLALRAADNPIFLHDRL